MPSRLDLDLLHGAVTLGDQETDFGASHLEQRIGGNRRAMSEKRDIPRIDTAGDESGDAGEYPERRIFGRARHLLDQSCRWRNRAAPDRCGSRPHRLPGGTAGAFRSSMILCRVRVCAELCFFVPSFAGHWEVVARRANGYSLCRGVFRHARCDMKLADQIAIITGAGRNIGEETAKLFAAEGARSPSSIWTAGGLTRSRAPSSRQGEKRRPIFATSPRKTRSSRRSKRWLRLGPGRHSHQQCRDLRQQAPLRHHQSRVGPRLRDLPHRAHAVQQICRQGDESTAAAAAESSMSARRPAIMAARAPSPIPRRKRASSI